MNVEGFREVYEQASEEIETEGQRFKVCTLSGIVILKLIARESSETIDYSKSLISHILDGISDTISSNR